MIAILSDIHANLEALEAVLADIERFPVEAIYCLGDIVGYGPDPIPCLQYAMKWPVVLLGNHEAAARGFDALEYGSPVWANSILRTRAQIRQHAQGADFTVFLWQLRSRFEQPGRLFVHGTPREPTNEYIFPEDIYNDKKMAVLTSLFDGICFCGHTHIPGIFRAATPLPPAPPPAAKGWSLFRKPEREQLPTSWEYVTPADCRNEYPQTGEKLICNVGSVGQPRDNDPRASYVLVTPEIIRFRRVDYDVAKTVKKIYDGPDDNMLGDRLRWGR